MRPQIRTARVEAVRFYRNHGFETKDAAHHGRTWRMEWQSDLR